MKLITTCTLLVVLLSANGQDTTDMQEEIQVISNHDLYLTGENIFLHVTCQIEGSPSQLSKFIYLELLDENNTAWVQKIFLLNNGQFNGAVFLPSTLKTGNYALIAYTQWSRNFDADSFGKKAISIVNPFEQLPQGLFMDDQATRSPAAETADVQISLSKRAYSPGDSISFSLSPSTADEQDVIVSVSKTSNRDTFYPSMLKSGGSTTPSQSYVPERRGHLLQGVVKDDSGNPKSVVLSLSSELMNKVRFTTSNSNGEFAFTVNQNQRKNSLRLKAEERITFDLSEPFIEKHDWDVPPLKMDSSLSGWILSRAREVQIDDEYFNDKYEVLAQEDSTGILNFLSSKTYYLDDFTRFPRLEDPILEYIPEIKMRTKRGTKIFSVANLSFSASDSTLVLLNGVPMSSKSLFNQNPNYIESITIYSSNVSLNGFEFAGIIHFKTYEKYYRNVQFYNSTTVDLSEPIYGEKRSDNPLPNFENQLLWKQVQMKGALTMKTVASMSKGSYEVKVLDHSGKIIGRKAFRIW